MGDFIIDLQAHAEGQRASLLESMRFHPSQIVESLAIERFNLNVSYFGSADLWAPYRTADNSLFVVVGMCALEDADWERAESLPGKGGLAAKAIRNLYRTGGLAAIENVSGNCAVLVFDAPKRKVHLVSDPVGAFPVFKCDTGAGCLFGSHPDLLARAAGEDQNRDEVSMAEFVVASMVTPPYTFYKRIQSVDTGGSVSVDLASGKQEHHCHYPLNYQGDPADNEADLADELADALKSAIRRRTHPRFGTPVVALSGGADSRLLLAAMEDPTRALTFTCYDQPNRELRTAEAIASSVGARFLPLQRSPDYYGENAEAGVRISGGMGTFANNHFLGVMDHLRDEGMGVLLTGCYFDYMFKGLPLNRSAHWLTGRETLAPFSHQFYFSHELPKTPLGQQIRERWEARIPTEIQRQSSDREVFDLEERRTFPLCYEGDNQQRLVPQRVCNWLPPVADRRVLNIYRRIPGRMKLNRSIFLRAARQIMADSPVGRVADANTGASLFASAPRTWISRNSLRIRRKLRSRRRTIASDESWPNWQNYVAHSPILEQLWRRPNPTADDLFRKVFGWDHVPGTPAEFSDGRTFLFVSLLTQKLWLHQRQS